MTIGGIDARPSPSRKSTSMIPPASRLVQVVSDVAHPPEQLGKACINVQHSLDLDARPGLAVRCSNAARRCRGEQKRLRPRIAEP